MKTIRQRFKHFEGQPWFDVLMEQLRISWNRDDEWSEQRIVDGLIEQLMLAGVADVGGLCWSCDAQKIELRYDGECNACTEAHEAAQERELARLEALTPEERRTCMHTIWGLVTRNVQ